MKKLLPILLLLSASSIFSQNHLIGIQGGVSRTRLDPSASSNETNYETGVMLGLNYQYQFKNKLQLGVDVLYDQRKYSFEYSYGGWNSTPIVEVVSEHSYNYISFPIKAGYSIGDKLSGFLNIGIVPSLFLGAERIDTPSQGSKVRTTDVSGSEIDLVLSLLFEIGASYEVKNQVLLFLLCNYQYGSYHQIQGYGITAGLGIRYKLLKN